MEHVDDVPDAQCTSCHAPNFMESAVTIRKFVEDGVESFEARIDGETIQWDRGLSYARHLQTERLLSSQIPVSDKPDEMLFIIIAQTMELWLKLVLHEAKLGGKAVGADVLGNG